MSLVTETLNRRSKPIPSGYSFFIKTSPEHRYYELDYPFCSFRVEKVSEDVYEVVSGTGPLPETLEGILGKSAEEFEAFLADKPSKHLVHNLTYPFDTGYSWDSFIAAFYANSGVIGVGIMEHGTATFKWLTKEDSHTIHAHQLCNSAVQDAVNGKEKIVDSKVPPWIRRIFD